MELLEAPEIPKPPGVLEVLELSAKDTPDITTNRVDRKILRNNILPPMTHELTCGKLTLIVIFKKCKFFVNKCVFIIVTSKNFP